MMLESNVWGENSFLFIHTTWIGNDLLKIRKMNSAELILKTAYSSAIALAAILKTRSARRLARCFLPAFLCAHIFIKRETSGYEAVQQLRCHSISYTNSRSTTVLSYEYIYLQLQHIFIHIQGQNFYSTLLLYSFNSLLMCWNSRIPCSFTLNDLILFHDYIHSRSKVKNFIQHCCYIYSTFYAHPSLRIPRLQPALSFGNRRPTMVIWSAPLRRCLREEIWTFNGGAQVFWN